MSKNLSIKPGKILLIRTDRIGDVILTLPMVNTLAHNYPNAKIDFLVNKRTAEILADYSNINKVHSIEKESVSEIRRICKENDYDLVIVVSPGFTIAAGIFLAGVKYRLGTRNRWYSFLFNIRHSQHRKYAIKHEMEYNLDLLNELSVIKIKNIKPLIKVKDEYINSARNSAQIRGFSLDTPFIVIHIPSLGSAKKWSSANFANLINLISDDKNLKINIVLTGTNSDLELINSVFSKIKSRSHIFAVTNLNLNELAALISLSRLFIGNSTGPIHIAAAVGTFVIGLYSPVKVESPVRWGPVTDKKKIFVPEKDDDSGDVMDDIKPEEVYNFVKEYITPVNKN